MSGLLVLMMLAGLMVMPVGAEEAVPSVKNGSFENVTFSTGETPALEAIEGWAFNADTKLTASVVTSADESYTVSPDGGNYVKIARTGESGNSVELYTDIANLQAETTYELSMYVNGGNQGAWLRIDYMNDIGGWLSAKDTYNPNVYFEKNYGSRYYNINGNNKWAIVKFNFTLPEGGGGIRLNLGLNSGTEAYYDGISVQKATNLISWGEFNGYYNDEEGKHVGLRFNSTWQTDGTYCGYEYWFKTTDGVIGAPSGGFWDGLGTINATETLEQFVPVKDGQLYKLKFQGKGYGAASDLMLKVTFAEDSDYTLTLFNETLVKDKMNTYEVYFYVDGDFMYGETPQKVTEARFTFSATATSRIDNVSLTEVEPIMVDTNISALEEGENIVTANATIFKKEWGGTDNAMLIAAVYEGNRITQLQIKTLVVGEADLKEDSVMVTATKGTNNVKVFLWNTTSGFAPVKDGIELR